MAKNFTLFSDNEEWNGGRMVRWNPDTSGPLIGEEWNPGIPTFQHSSEGVHSDILSPGDAVINNILSFSKALKIEKSREVGLIEIVLN